MGRPHTSAAALAAAPTDRFVAHWRSRGLPWCDTCEQPAVLTVALGGWRHATAMHRDGLPKHLDPADHAVTTLQWQRGHTDPDDPRPVLVANSEDDPR